MRSVLKYGVWKYGVILILLLGLFFYWQWASGWGWKNKVYKVASGQHGAGYHTVAQGMLEVSEKDDVKIKLMPILSDGSVENMKLVSERKADFGLVQLGGEVSDDLRAVANIYDDVVHILLRNEDDLAQISDLSGKKIACGLDGSGTRLVALQILGHYGLNSGHVAVVNASPEESVRQLLASEVDAVILVTAAQAPVIVDGILTGKIKHFTMGQVGEPANEADGFCMRYQKFRATVIPKHAFGRNSRQVGGDRESYTALPREAVSVVSVPSLLVCRKDTHPEAVREMTRALYANKHVLGKHYNALQHLSEPKDLDQFVYPLHDGAKLYYQRRAPGFLVVYAEVIALMLSVTIALFGVISALRQWSAVKHKNRIDEYYKKLNSTLKRLESNEADPVKEEQMLLDLRAQAYDELVKEKLYANESFRIFQDLLEQCLDEVRKERN